MEDFEEGDIIAFNRAGGFYMHCGIYDGKGKVIHRGTEPGSGSGAALDPNSSFVSSGVECWKAEIRRDDYKKVAGSSVAYKENMFDKNYKPRPGSVIVKWAKKQIGKKGYNLLTKNCQHFCTEARYGIRLNMQAIKWIDWLFGLLSWFDKPIRDTDYTDEDYKWMEGPMLMKNQIEFDQIGMKEIMYANTSAEENVWTSLVSYFTEITGKGVEFDIISGNLDNHSSQLEEYYGNLDEDEQIRFIKQYVRVWHRVYVKQHNDCQQWLLDRKDIARERQADLKVMNEKDYEKCMIFFADFIQALGEHLVVSPEVIATATVYFKIFYVRNSLKCIDPWLMAPTSIFLASKVLGFGVISNSRLVTTCQTVVKNEFSHAYPQEYPYRINSVLECESYLLEMKDFCLVVYNPYRPLVLYVSDISSEDDEYKSIFPLAGRIVNDSLLTDVPLLYPTYLIALSALHIACLIQQKDLKQWFAELSVDMHKILEITRQVLHLYELRKTYDEKKEIAPVLQNMPKPKTSPSPPPQNPGQEGQTHPQTQ